MLSGLKLFCDSLGLKFRGFGSALFEFIYCPGNVQQVLAAGIEGMAVGANFNMQFLFGGTGDKGVATGANDLGIRKILWVNLVFHNLRIIA